MQYIRAQKVAPWVSSMNEVEDRARWALQHLGGMAGDWNTQRPYCYYYYPQRKTNE
jgi:hypothetical protein